MEPIKSHEMTTLDILCDSRLANGSTEHPKEFPEGSLTCPHDTCTGLYPESEESNPHTHLIYLTSILISSCRLVWVLWSSSLGLCNFLLSPFLWLYSPILGLGRLHKTFRFISVTRSRTVGRSPCTGDQLVARPLHVCPRWLWWWRSWWNETVFGGGNRSTRRKPAPAPFCPPQIPLANPGANPGCRGGKPATNRLSYGAASNLLDLISSNLSDLGITPVYPGLIKPDNYHPPIIIDIYLPFACCIQNYAHRTANSRLEIMHSFTIFSELLTGLVWTVPPLTILLSPASMLLFKMPWNMQFPVAS
jgi:hypothetical protein